ncbi:preprotein translocase subunit SecE [Algiphilus sp.]|uniref:preprotein translocase subunit SecE n=1 Tax=Algiphilus sp. TaxID=1872431 RepID=UPI001CA7202C|nr:preprotein translocase subunit SecE [Algiphilus sp.]MBY8967179.1 preprotein translocase subunit SecE [Algiphilus acroporae]MCI5062897.1 preprotein translocase subunit SecE [Algiphilus sp.]MCI5104362.1 preprotein translocase subunit SecE [Algiphilus sp.]
MSNSNQASGGSLDTLWMLAALATVVGGVAAFYLLEPQYNVAIRAGIVVASVAVAAGLFYQTANGRSAWGYLVGARIEMRKTTFPTRQESVQTTLLIAVVVLIVSLFLWGLDSFLLWAVKLLTGRG